MTVYIYFASKDLVPKSYQFPRRNAFYIKAIIVTEVSDGILEYFIWFK